MPDACCTFVKPDGSPCAARPLAASPFCLFHDPAHAPALAAARSKGGAAPRHIRRYPILLNHLHVAELLGELFITALNHTDPTDTPRLRALTHLSRALLQAVGTPPTFLYHCDRNEPSPDLAHLRRLFREEESLPTVAPTDPEHPTPDTHHRRPTEQAPEYASVGIGNYLAWEAAVAFPPSEWDQPEAAAPDPVIPQPVPATIASEAPCQGASAVAAAETSDRSTAHCLAEPAQAPEEQQDGQAPGQAMDRCGTGPSATKDFDPQRHPSSSDPGTRPENPATDPAPSPFRSDPASSRPTAGQTPVTPSPPHPLTSSPPHPPW